MMTSAAVIDSFDADMYHRSYGSTSCRVGQLSMQSEIANSVVHHSGLCANIQVVLHCAELCSPRHLCQILHSVMQCSSVLTRYEG